MTSEERRRDAADGNWRSLEELRKFCQGHYSSEEIDDYWSKMEVASTAAASNPSVSRASSPEAGDTEQMPGLHSLLKTLNLSHYQKQAEQWVEDSGAAHVSELLDNIDDFADQV